jgi:hypothetical protein
VTAVRRVPAAAAAALAFVLLLVVGAPAGAQDTPPTTAAQVEDDSDAPTTLPEELGNIVGSPDPGPEPEDAGDRGGWAQLGLLGVLVLVVALVLRHLFRSANRNEPPAEA